MTIMDDKGNMSDNNKFMKMLKDSQLEDPFLVPEGYFEQSHERIVSRCADIRGQHISFQLPQGYFDTLSDRIALKVTEENLKSRVSGDGFEVPTGYFEALQRRSMLAAKQPDLDATVVVRKLSTPNWLRYAAAACAVFMVGISGYLMLNDQDAATEQTFLANVSDQELVEYLRFYSESSDLIYITEHVQRLPERTLDSDLSIDDIEFYLSNTL